MRREYSQPRVFEYGQQSCRAMIPARNGNNGRGCPQDGRGGKQRCCGGKGMGNKGIGNAQPGREVARVVDKAQCYVFPIKNKAEASDAVITNVTEWLMHYLIRVPTILMCL